MSITEILSLVGQIAGLGGLAFGVFLIIVKEVLKRVPPPKSMDRERYSNIINRVLFFTFLISLTGLLLYGTLSIFGE